MDLKPINPVDYPDWDDLLLAAGDSSFFHTSGWARVLAESYGYKPVYFAGFDASRLSLLMPFMGIASPLTGRRGVSLPFTDYCNPFAAEKALIPEAARTAMDHGKRAKWNYIEWRSSENILEGAVPSESYLTHDLDLDRTESELFSRLQESNRRNIRKSIKDGVTITFDSSSDSLREFYRLHCRTRKRHGLPPQPLSFFKNILNHILGRGLGTIATARLSGKTIAASVFFHFGTTAIFKYGASNMQDLGHRPNNLVIWEAMKWYKAMGIKTLSLGRTEADNPGLQHFKRSWGGVEKTLNYYRYDLKKDSFFRTPTLGDHPRELISRVPCGVLRVLGRVLYRHIG